MKYKGLGIAVLVLAALSLAWGEKQAHITIVNGTGHTITCSVSDGGDYRPFGVKDRIFAGSSDDEYVQPGTYLFKCVVIDDSKENGLVSRGQLTVAAGDDAGFNVTIVQHPE